MCVCVRVRGKTSKQWPSSAIFRRQLCQAYERLACKSRLLLSLLLLFSGWQFHWYECMKNIRNWRWINRSHWERGTWNGGTEGGKTSHPNRNTCYNCQRNNGSERGASRKRVAESSAILGYKLISIFHLMLMKCLLHVIFVIRCFMRTHWPPAQ